MNYLMLRTKGKPAWNPAFLVSVLDEESYKVEELKTDKDFTIAFQKAKYVPLNEVVRLELKDELIQEAIIRINDYSFGAALFCSEKFRK